MIDTADVCYFYPWPTMSTAPSETPATVSLAEEEAVRRILVDTLFGLWATVNNLTRLRPSRHERYRCSGPRAPELCVEGLALRRLLD